MPKYLLGYHGGSQPQSPEEGEKVTAAWRQWIGANGSSMVDAGNPIMVSKTIASSGSVSNGGGANALSGYSVVDAPDMDAAVKIAMECPLLKAGGTIEVGETINLM